MLKIHFLNVGHGDCCIIEFDSNRIAMIDINRSTEVDNETANEIASLNNIIDWEWRFSRNKKMLLEHCSYNIKLTDPIEYLKNNSINSIFRFISTHPHMDHLLGLNCISTSNIWICKNDFSQDEDSLSEEEENSWNTYKKFRENIGEKLDYTTILDLREGAEGQFYSDDGIYILAPNEKLLNTSKEKDNRNIMSTVLLVKYGECKIILGGDAEEDTWNHIYENYYEEIKDVSILKASHHGRDSGYHQESIKTMNPEYTIVSVGKKPSTDASNKYRQYSGNVYSTRWKGTIVFECYSNGSIYPYTEYDR